MKKILLVSFLWALGASAEVSCQGLFRTSAPLLPLVSQENVLIGYLSRVLEGSSVVDRNASSPLTEVGPRLNLQVSILGKTSLVAAIIDPRVQGSRPLYRYQINLTGGSDILTTVAAVPGYPGVFVLGLSHGRLALLDLREWVASRARPIQLTVSLGLAERTVAPRNPMRGTQSDYAQAVVRLHFVPRLAVYRLPVPVGGYQLQALRMDGTTQMMRWEFIIERLRERETAGAEALPEIELL